MPCMCGDLYCRSCGPAQGNYRCEECGAWTADGGCQDPARCEAAIIRRDEELQAEYEALEAYREFRDMWRGGGPCE